MTHAVVAKLLHRQLAAELVDETDRERALVCIDSHEQHLDLRSDRQYDRAERRARMRGASQAPIKRRRSPMVSPGGLTRMHLCLSVKRGLLSSIKERASSRSRAAGSRARGSAGRPRR